MKLNKTQKSIVERLEGKHGIGNYVKFGWGLENNYLKLSKLNEIDQAYKLAQNYPDKFRTTTILFRLVKIEKIKGN